MNLSAEDWRNIFLAIISGTTTILVIAVPLLFKWFEGNRANDRAERDERLLREAAARADVAEKVANVAERVSSVAASASEAHETMKEVKQIVNGRTDAMLAENAALRDEIARLKGQA